MGNNVTLIPYSIGGHSLAEEQTLLDIARFSSELDFRPYYLYLPSSRKGITQWIARQYNNVLLSKLKGDVILFPYPPSFWLGDSKLSRVYRVALERVIHVISRGFHFFIIYVYDLPIEQTSYTRPQRRSTHISSVDYSIEEKLFEIADKILVFNKAMEDVIRGRYELPKSKFVHFEILDMGVNFAPPVEKIIGKAKNLVYVGNLHRDRTGELESTLRRVPQNVHLTFIGPNGDWLNMLPNTNYLGVLPDDKFYQILSNNDFGILWYSQNAARYFRFSSSAKFSTYMTAGLPVLVDKHAQWPAELVKKYKVGIVADNLEKLLYKAAKVDDEEYLKMRRNVLSLGEKIKRGYFLKTALQKALK